MARFDKAFEVDALSIAEQIGIFGGSSDPWVDAEDPPVGSLHISSSGKLTRFVGPTNDMSGWAEVTGGGVSIGGVCLKLVDKWGNELPIAANLGDIEIKLKGGGTVNLQLVGCNG